MLKYRRVIPNPTRTIMWLGNPMRTCLPMQNMGLWEYENSNRFYWIEYNSCFPLLSLTSGIVVSGLPLPHMRNELAYDNWLLVLTILKNISQWEGLSHILWKIKKFQTTNQLLCLSNLFMVLSWLLIGCVFVGVHRCIAKRLCFAFLFACIPQAS